MCTLYLSSCVPQFLCTSVLVCKLYLSSCVYIVPQFLCTSVLVCKLYLSSCIYMYMYVHCTSVLVCTLYLSSCIYMYMYVHCTSVLLLNHNSTHVHCTLYLCGVGEDDDFISVFVKLLQQPLQNLKIMCETCIHVHSCVNTHAFPIDTPHHFPAMPFFQLSKCVGACNL